MKRLPALFLLTLPLACFAQKGAPLPDSFKVIPTRSACIDFSTDRVGQLTRRDSTSWHFTSIGIRQAKRFGVGFKSAVPHDKALFNDCVLFEPVRQTAAARKDAPFMFSHFFIQPFDKDFSDETGIVPASIRFYTDTIDMQPMIDGNRLSSTRFPEEKIPDYLRPFYFKKHEVTNAEYREFVDWVLDSIIRTRLGYLLPNGGIDRKPKYDKATALGSLGMWKPQGERFYYRNEVDARKINYRFNHRPAELNVDTLNIYPDTLSWINDFAMNFNEPLSSLYFWHPAYYQYPVAGVTYWQCLAFLDWKSKQLQAIADKKGLKCKVKCELPSELEWDYVSTAERSGDETFLVSRYYTGTCDDSWLTDLLLQRNSGADQKVFNHQPEEIRDSSHVLFPGRTRPQHIMVFADDFDQPLRRLDLGNQKTWGDFVYDGYYHPGPVNIEANGFPKKKHKNSMQQPNERSRAHYDEATGICWMDGNVSEWLREDVSQWRGIFSKHLLIVNNPYAAEQKVVRDYEKYYFDRLPREGKLIRGCNWYDERFAMKYSKNVGGLQSKTFCDPDEAHCTVGFRYVIYLEEK